MTSAAQILFDLLKQRGFDVKDVWYEPNFAWHPACGWYFEDRDGSEYRIGKNFTEARANIGSGNFKKME